MATKKEAAKPATEGEAKSAKGKWIAIGLAIVLALGGGGGAVWFLLGKAGQAEAKEAGEKAAKKSKKAKKDKTDEAADEQAEAEEPKSPAQYLALDPAFVVNLAGADADRYLQVQVELMTRDAKFAEAIKLHTPAIRDRLLLLFGTRSAQELSAREGREALRQLALSEVQKVMQEETGDSAVEALYFTSFVTQ